MATPRGDFYRRFGDQVAQLRRGQRLTQARLAAATSISRSSIANIEKGRQLVGVHLLVKLARTLGVPVGDLIPLDVETPSSVHAEQKLAELPENQRAWVMKVIDVSLGEGSDHATTVRAGSKKGGGVAQESTRRRTPGAR